jgi:hypothetical protein
MATTAVSPIAAQSSLSVWAPPPGVTGHTGEPIPPESVFFVPPPPEIGEIQSAYASLKVGAKTRSRGGRIVLTVIWAIVPILVAAAIVFLGGATFEQGVIAFGIAVVSGAVAAAIAWNVTRFKHACEFVGSDGCIVLKCRDAVDNVTVEKSLRFGCRLTLDFDDAVLGGSCRNTIPLQWFPTSKVFSFRLIDEKERRPWAVHNLGRAIENAWYAYLLPKPSRTAPTVHQFRWIRNARRLARDSSKS